MPEHGIPKPAMHQPDAQRPVFVRRALVDNRVPKRDELGVDSETPNLPGVGLHADRARIKLEPGFHHIPGNVKPAPLHRFFTTIPPDRKKITTRENPAPRREQGNVPRNAIFRENSANHFQIRRRLGKNPNLRRKAQRRIQNFKNVLRPKPHLGRIHEVVAEKRRIVRKRRVRVRKRRVRVRKRRVRVRNRRGKIAHNIRRNPTLNNPRRRIRALERLDQQTGQGRLDPLQVPLSILNTSVGPCIHSLTKLRMKRSAKRGVPMMIKRRKAVFIQSRKMKTRLAKNALANRVARHRQAHRKLHRFAFDLVRMNAPGVRSRSRHPVSIVQRPMKRRRDLHPIIASRPIRINADHNPIPTMQKPHPGK